MDHLHARGKAATLSVRPIMVKVVQSLLVECFNKWNLWQVLAEALNCRCISVTKL